MCTIICKVDLTCSFMILSRPGDLLFFNDLTADIISLSVIG